MRSATMMSTQLETDRVWPLLSARQLAEAAEADEERLTLERSRLPERTARLLDEPVYSLRARVSSWERLTLRLAGDGELYVEEYVNDLESRDQLDRLLEAREPLNAEPVTGLLARLDARFDELTVDDAGEALRPYVRALREGAPLAGRWYRRPERASWA
ncbi:hypothetical protein [Spirillospora sp. CA-294931]|uniref:hypothetical protein n=1 Tax=Spirillospora sp. CA-294931 TaxID=3240042 RepID=UPI003D8CA1D0